MLRPVARHSKKPPAAILRAKGQYVMMITGQSATPEIGATLLPVSVSNGFLNTSGSSQYPLRLVTAIDFDWTSESFLFAVTLRGASSQQSAVRLTGVQCQLGGDSGDSVGQFFGADFDSQALIPSNNDEYSALIAYDAKKKLIRGHLNSVGSAPVPHYNPSAIPVSSLLDLIIITADGPSQEVCKGLHIIKFKGGLPGDLDELADFYHNNPLQKLSKWAQ